MLRSYSNTLVSVRRVTQINKGRHTPGVDKLVVKTPQARGELVDQIQTTYQPWRSKPASPARRVYIPKANGKQRPLGIPTVIDRVIQAKVKNALEPCWEARFEGVSYGFRPGRGCHDAIAQIFNLARPNMRKKWVVDADIKGAFDNISHDHLLEAIGLCPGRELIKQWLKAGYMENGVFHDTEAGTPQGGVISPLLANIALHGMEEALGARYNKQGHTIGNRALVRYADDFVVFCESREDAEAVIQTLKGWLGERGLTLSEEKTRIVHLTEGFDFLGFNVRQYKTPRTSRYGYKLLIKPSKESVKAIRKKLRDKWLSLRGYDATTVVVTLNPIIRGWANYFRIGVASETFKVLDQWMYIREFRYAKHAHPTKPWKWRRKRYWGKLNPRRNSYSVFGDKRTGSYLIKFTWFTIKRHVLVRGRSSPDNPAEREYWAKRAKRQVETLPLNKQKLAKAQNYLCPLCGDSLFNDEELQIHHVRPRSQGGLHYLDNLRLVHLYCQLQIHGGEREAKDEKGRPLLRLQPQAAQAAAMK
jgi:RNA-directed DNA polymerase